MLPPIPMISLHPCSPHVIPPLPISYFLIPVQSLFLIYPQCIFCFHLSPSTSLCLSCYLVSLGMWMVEWLSFALQLITTYNWVHYTFVFLGLCYLTWDDSEDPHLHSYIYGAIIMINNPEIHTDKKDSIFQHLLSSSIFLQCPHMVKVSGVSFENANSGSQDFSHFSVPITFGLVLSLELIDFQPQCCRISLVEDETNPELNRR